MNRKKELKELKEIASKGFSLVELIVVIAIMAILVGLVAPQFSKYVQKSKSSTDQQNCSRLEEAANIVLADEALSTTGLPTSTTDTKTFNVTGSTTTVGADGTFMKLLSTSLNGNFPEVKGSNGKFVITVKMAADGGYTATCEIVAN